MLEILNPCVYPLLSLIRTAIFAEFMAMFQFPKRPLRSKPNRRANLMVEMLEDRTLLSASPMAEFALLGKPAPAPQYQWDMTKIKAPSVWSEVSASSAKVIVADIDTGIDYTHPDLYKNVWINQGEIPASRFANLVDLDGDELITFWDLNDPSNQGIGKITDIDGNGQIDAGDILAPMTKDNLFGNDTGVGGWADGIDDGNDYLDDLIGWNFVLNNNNPFDDNGHGTHTAGTIGAMHNGIGNGVDGVYGFAQIMALKAFDQDGGGESFEIAIGRATEAIYYSADNGARVSNNSWGVYGMDLTSPAMEALQVAIATTPNVLFVSSAGNNGVNNDTHWAANYPSSYSLSNIIAVAATSSNDQKPIWSNYGKTTVDLGAPGANVVSTVPGGGYASYSGTSMAAPHVAGAAAFLLAANPTLNLSTSDLKTAILGGVDKVRSMANTVSGGRLNVEKANNLASPGATLTNTGDSGDSKDESGPPPRNSGSLSLTLTQMGITEVDLKEATSPRDQLLVFGSIPMNADSPFSQSFRYSPNVVNMPEIPTRLPLKADARVEGILAVSSFGFSDETEAMPMQEMMPDKDWFPELRTSGVSYFSHRLDRPGVGARSALPPTVLQTNVMNVQAAQRDEAIALDTGAASRSAQCESAPSGFFAELISGTASKVFWLAAAALFFAQGAFLSRSQADVEEETRKRICV
jgi:subtilisin family serine protease